MMNPLEAEMVKVWIAVLANFFFPGLGYLVLGRRLPSAVLQLVGILGLTWVELSLQSEASALYWPMFASVFAMNTGFAIDAWREGTTPAPVTT